MENICKIVINWNSRLQKNQSQIIFQLPQTYDLNLIHKLLNMRKQRLGNMQFESKNKNLTERIIISKTCIVHEHLYRIIIS